jgi:hypothetical protein
MGRRPRPYGVWVRRNHSPSGPSSVETANTVFTEKVVKFLSSGPANAIPSFVGFSIFVGSLS